ncbi:MAG: hypothetical protein NVSMB42_18750 [Herpetosiphon sp.]
MVAKPSIDAYILSLIEIGVFSTHWPTPLEAWSLSVAYREPTD